MPERLRKRPSDPKELAKQLVDEATGDAPKFDPNEGKDPAAVALGRKGGLKGGKARAESMTPEQRSEAARKAAAARWKTRPSQLVKTAPPRARRRVTLPQIDLPKPAVRASRPCCAVRMPKSSPSSIPHRTAASEFGTRFVRTSPLASRSEW
jgi:hypothetical protein